MLTEALTYHYVVIPDLMLYTPMYSICSHHIEKAFPVEETEDTGDLLANVQSILLDSMALTYFINIGSSVHVFVDFLQEWMQGSLCFCLFDLLHQLCMFSH